MGTEPRAERGEPPIFRWPRLVFAQRFGQGKENRGAAHVAVAAQNFPRNGEVVSGQFCFQGGKHVFAARVAEDTGDRRPMAGGCAMIEVSYGIGGQAGYGGMEQIPQLATALLEPDTVAVFRIVVRVE